MKLNIRVLAALLMIFMGFESYAQQQDEPDILEQAEMEADRLQRLLYLEDWQTFKLLRIRTILPVRSAR